MKVERWMAAGVQAIVILLGGTRIPPLSQVAELHLYWSLTAASFAWMAESLFNMLQEL
jgi:hypothetical protein